MNERKSWRPEDWEDRKEIQGWRVHPYDDLCYEAGADAILAALIPLLEYCWPMVRLNIRFDVGQAWNHHPLRDQLKSILWGQEESDSANSLKGATS